MVIVIVVIAMVVMVIVVLFLRHAKRSVTVIISGGTQSNGFGELVSGMKIILLLWIRMMTASNNCHDINSIRNRLITLFIWYRGCTLHLTS